MAVSTRARNRIVMVILALLAGLVAAIHGASPASAEPTQSAQIGMPFTGKWAYNIPTTAACGPANSQTSHPSCHEIYYGDWSTDLHAAEGTPVKFLVNSSSGNLTYSWGSFPDGTCGQRTVINVFIDGVSIAGIYYEHLNNAVKSGPISNGMTVGTVHAWPSGCNPGPHVHMELRNVSGYACYYNKSTAQYTAGMTIPQGESIGKIGKTGAGGTRVACSDTGGGGGGTGGGGNYPVMNTSESPPDGVYFRNSPHTADTDRVTGHGVFSGDVVHLQCYAFGDAVGAFNNTLWYYVNNVTRPTVSGNGTANVGYLNAHYINDGASAGQVDPGVSACGSGGGGGGGTPPLTPSVGVSPTSGARGTVYQGSGTGFSPSATISVKVTQPDGAEYFGTYTHSRSTDGSGHFSWTWIWDHGDEYGTYHFTATDPTGPSASVDFTITPPDMSHPAPLLGFDAASAPSEATMNAWLASPYRAIGVYLPVHAPESDDRFDKNQVNLTPTWVRDVNAMGYSFLPIYLGKQAPQACFPADYWHIDTNPSTATAQGQTAADDAIASITALGMPVGSPIYYDMEPYSSGCSVPVLAFFDGWDSQLQARGYVAGIYGARSSVMTDLVSKVGVSGYHLPDAVWVETNNGSNGVVGLGTPPDGLWSNHQRVNQADLDLVQTYGGVTINTDVDPIDGPVVSQLNPVITTTSLPEGIVGVGYDATLSAAGAGGQFNWSLVSGSLPAGVSLTTTGHLSGTPTAVGTSTIVVRASDADHPNLFGTATLQISVVPIKITTTSLSHGVIDKAYTAKLAVAGGKGSYVWTLASGSVLPAGLKLATTGAISGTPTVSGTSTFTVKVTDGSTPKLSVQRTLSLTIDPMTITTSALPNPPVGKAYTGKLVVSGGKSGWVWSVAGGSLPTGLKLSTTGSITGVPSVVGVSTFTVSVHDAAKPAHVATRALSISVVPMSISPAALPGGLIAKPYTSTTLKALGGKATYVWSVASGALPTGLKLSASGVVSGTPTVAGTFAFTVSVADGSTPKYTAQRTYSVNVAAMTIATTSLPSGTVKKAYPSTTLKTSGGKTAFAWTVTAGSLPPGLKLSTSGTISGTPTTAGTYTFTVHVTDGSTPKNVATRQFTISIG